jgi:hypothetical protein
VQDDVQDRLHRTPFVKQLRGMAGLAGHVLLRTRATIATCTRPGGDIMRNRFAAVLAAAGVMLGSLVGLAPSVAYADKPIFNGFRYNKMPSFAGCGLSTIKIFYEGELFGGKSKSQPNISQLKNVIVPQILKKKWDYVVIDIEVWDEITEMDKLILAMKTIRNGVRAKGGKSKLGYYMMLPEKNWNAPVSGQSGKNRAWQSNNDKLKRLAKEVDVIFPSLYTMFDNKGDWVRYAKANIAEAKQYGKPVFPFIWPQIHNWNKSDGQKYMSASFWKTQLQTVHSLSNGVVIWGSMTTKKGRRGWDTWRSGMPWWEVTKDFAKANGTAKFSGCRA